uniref:HTH La-type RNA-binding domain-containing protein n=1 Tax=Aureoumbra lagunensis TaxID=44058 RepID=A0A7S3K289_9STRA
MVAHGERNEAIEILEDISMRWSTIERYARTAIMHGSDTTLLLTEKQQEANLSWAAVFEETQQEISRLRAVLGSFYVESGQNAQAKALLIPTCPTLWFFSRRALLGDDAVRGEVSWLRCYSDLVNAHKALNENKAARILERDIVAHSTTWLRARRDSKPQKNSSKIRPKLGRRRQHELESRWPLRTPRLRAPRNSHHAPKSSTRLARNEKIVRTLFFLSKLSVLSPSERAVTARDSRRAQSRAKQSRRELEAWSEALAEAPDVLHSAKVLFAMREFRDAIYSELTFQQQSKQVEDATRWNAGVALAAMLRTNSPQNAANSVEKNESAVGAILESLSEQVTTTAPKSTEQEAIPQQHKNKAIPTTVRPFGPAFARHVLAEVNEYLDIATKVHNHGWSWLQHEAARLEDEHRRSALAIAPTSGPPPGFASRLEIVHILAGFKTNAVKRAERYSAQQKKHYPPPPYQQHQQHKKGGSTRSKSKSKNSLQDDITNFLKNRPSPSVTALFVFGASAFRGSYILREQQRRETDGYTKRRPKRTTRQWIIDTIAYFCLAIGVCFSSTWTNLHKALVPTIADDARAVKRALYGLYLRLCSRFCTSHNGRQIITPTTTLSSSDSIKLSGTTQSTQRRAVSQKKMSAAPQKRRAVTTMSNNWSQDQRNKEKVTQLTASSLDNDSNSFDKACELFENDEWRPVPKGGRVKGESSRVVAAAAKAPVVNLREQLATVGNAGTSAVDVVAKTNSDNENSCGEEEASRNSRKNASQETSAVPSPQKKRIRQTTYIVSNSCNSSVDDDGDKYHQQQQKQYSRKAPKETKKKIKVSAILKRDAQPDRGADNRTPPPPQQAVNKVSPTNQHKSPNKKKSQQSRTAKAKAPRALTAPRSPRPGDEGVPSSNWQESLHYYFPQSSLELDEQQRFMASPHAGGNSPRIYDYRYQQKRVVTPPYQLYEAIRLQVEYYFSVSNLAKDIYLRTNCMDEEGYVSLGHIASFKRVIALTTDLNIIWDALLDSTKLELREDPTDITNCKVRTKDQPERWSPKYFQVASSSEE